MNSQDFSLSVVEPRGNHHQDLEFQLSGPHDFEMRWSPFGLTGIYLNVMLLSPCCHDTVFDMHERTQINLRISDMEGSGITCDGCNRLTGYPLEDIRFLRQAGESWTRWDITDEQLGYLQGIFELNFGRLEASLLALTVAHLIMDFTAIADSLLTKQLRENGSSLNNVNVYLQKQLAEEALALWREDARVSA